MSMDTTGMDIFSPVKTEEIGMVNSLFPTVEDIKKQAQMEHSSNKINTKLSTENIHFRPTIGSFKTFDSSKLDISANLGNTSTRLSMYNYKSFKPSHDDRALLSPSGPKKKQKFDTPPLGMNEDVIEPINGPSASLTPTLENIANLSFEDPKKQSVASSSKQGERMTDDDMGAPESSFNSSFSTLNNPPKSESTQQLITPPQFSSLSGDKLKEIVKDTVQDSLFSLQNSVHQDITNLHVDILRQFHLQQEQQYSLIEQLSKQVQNLTEEVKALREENQQLKNLI